MATVPRLTGPSVASTAAPDFRQQSTVSADLLSIRDKQLGQAGDAMVSAGASYDIVQRQLVDRANALRVDDALNQATERALRLQHDPKDGYTALKGYDALNRPDGLPLAEEYTGKLDTEFSNIAAGLGNDRQREMFNQRANNIRTQFLGNALQHTGQQAQVYDLSVREAGVATASNALVLNFSDPINVKQQVEKIRGSIMGAQDPQTDAFIPGSAQMAGKSAAWAQEKADEAVSGAHLGAISAAMEAGNVNGAMAYRKKYADQITASDMLKIDGTLTKNYDTMVGAKVGSTVMQSAQAAINPNDFDRFTNVIMGAESRGRDFAADGSVLTSPKGAKGRMQVMDATNGDPGFGVRPAANDSLEERARVGRDYLAAMVKRYDGNIAKASAAYNAGPGAVDDAVKAAEKNAGKGEQVPPDAWLASMPAETRAYVASVSKKMADPAASAPQRPTLEQLQQAARAQLGPNASPLAVKSAVDTIGQQFDAQTKAIEQRKTETVTAAMQALDQNGGRYSDLPPSMRSKLTQLAPDKVDEVMNYGQRIAKGDDITDDRLYLRLSNNPQQLKAMSDAQFYQLKGGLSKEDFKHFSNIRGDLLSGKSGNTAGDLNEQAVNRVFNQRLQTLGLPTNPDKRDTDAEQRIGAMRSYVDKRVMAAQQAAGRKLTDAETSKVIDETFSQNVQFRNTFLGFETGGTTGQPLMSTKVNDIPSATVDKIKKAFAANGVSKPTDGQILGVYFEGMGQRGKQAPRGGATGAF
ncbi:transglycosylase SLT domain-containing protein [Variovorax sp. J31P207]|uniref:transglycosylase SLT domain-containing protein n=1 Tax=Variovorax sp. J31P207 TaxID=3053510 RepID=UPI00257717B7|nr:transglycosylase SLT domain-containing protein [Variovorax sp. J31P207]MDM0072077.1 transglycosylase SLT domain-containing protein [Variovorax sp. J31P207]